MKLEHFQKTAIIGLHTSCSCSWFGFNPWKPPGNFPRKKKTHFPPSPRRITSLMMAWFMTFALRRCFGVEIGHRFPGGKVWREK